VLHAAARVVQEMGRSRAAAFALGLQDIDEGVHVNTFAETVDSHDSETNENPHPEGILIYNFFFCFLVYACISYYLYNIFMAPDYQTVMFSFQVVLNCFGL
jgi:hypothetical protein